MIGTLYDTYMILIWYNIWYLYDSLPLPLVPCITHLQLIFSILNFWYNLLNSNWFLSFLYFIFVALYWFRQFQYISSNEWINETQRSKNWIVWNSCQDDVIARSGDVVSRNEINVTVVSRRKVSEKSSTWILDISPAILFKRKKQVGAGGILSLDLWGLNKLIIIIIVTIIKNGLVYFQQDVNRLSCLYNFSWFCMWIVGIVVRLSEFE